MLVLIDEHRLVISPDVTLFALNGDRHLRLRHPVHPQGRTAHAHGLRHNFGFISPEAKKRRSLQPGGDRNFLLGDVLDDKADLRRGDFQHLRRRNLDIDSDRDGQGSGGDFGKVDVGT